MWPTKLEIINNLQERLLVSAIRVCLILIEKDCHTILFVVCKDTLRYLAYTSKLKLENVIQNPFTPEYTKKVYEKARQAKGSRPFSLKETFKSTPIIDKLGVQIRKLREK